VTAGSAKNLIDSLEKFLLDPSSENRETLTSFASEGEGESVDDWTYRLVNDAELGEECGPNACTSEAVLEVLFDEFGEDISLTLASNPYISLELALKLCRIDDRSSEGYGGTPAILARFTRHEQVLRILSGHEDSTVVYEVASSVLTPPDVLSTLAKSSYAEYDRYYSGPAYKLSVQFAVAMNENSPEIALKLIASGDYAVNENSHVDGYGNTLESVFDDEYNKGIQEAARARLSGQK
jgi:hypothetical protein